MVIHEIIELIYTAYSGRCVTLGQVVDFVRKANRKASQSLVKLALDIMVRDGRASKIKLYKLYAVYCIGKKPHAINIVDHKKTEECIERHMPSAMLMNIAECILGRRPAGSPIPVYLAILYVLARMVRKGRIHSFIILRDARDRLKVIIQK
jgi:hypothetical protein